MAQWPHLRILEIGMNYGYEVTNDALSIRGFQEYRCNDYHLGTMSVFVSSVFSMLFCLLWEILYWRLNLFLSSNPYNRTYTYIYL